MNKHWMTPIDTVYIYIKSNIIYVEMNNLHIATIKGSSSGKWSRYFTYMGCLAKWWRRKYLILSQSMSICVMRHLILLKVSTNRSEIDCPHVFINFSFSSVTIVMFIARNLTYNYIYVGIPLQWHHNRYDGVSNHPRPDYLQIKENIKAPRHWPLRGKSTNDR